MIIKKSLHGVAVLLAAMIASSAAAQSTTFDPANPPEPLATYQIKVSATPAQYATASGTGFYRSGTRVYINASSRDVDYEFKYWEQDGVRIDQPRGFFYTVEQAPVEFRAVFGLVDFDPTSPADPSMNYSWRLYLESDPEEASSFNLTSGTRVAPGQWASVTAYPSQGFIFDGWYEGGQRISTSLSFNYEMGRENVTLRARFHFDPSSPSDPGSAPGQSDVDKGKLGDTNGDGQVDSTDVVAIINAFLNSTEYKRVYDINGDGSIDSQDVTAVINIFLNGN